MVYNKSPQLLRVGSPSPWERGLGGEDSTGAIFCASKFTKTNNKTTVIKIRRVH